MAFEPNAEEGSKVTALSSLLSVVIRCAEAQSTVHKRHLSTGNTTHAHLASVCVEDPNHQPRHMM
jgi:hypothetical protein